MSKLSFTVYPAVAVLSLAAAFSAHAQSANDPIDQAAYGAMPPAQFQPAKAANTASTAKAAVASLQAAVTGSRSWKDFDPVDHAGYGAMPATGVSLRTRAEVRAEAIAARDADVDAAWREGGDPQYAVLKRVRQIDTAHLVASTSAKSGE